jgi:nicotinate-nucleotide adenylyltransferase
MLRILYGGTFDPVHQGHLAIARAVAAAYEHSVTLVPAADPPHRPPPGASADQRATMLELAIDGDQRLSVDRRELRRDGRSFTVDTLRQVRGEVGPEASIIWVLGMDSLLQLDTWHDWQHIFDLANVLGVQRPRTQVDASWLAQKSPGVYAEVNKRWCDVGQLSHRPAGGYAALSMSPLREESATDVRQRVAAGQDWSQCVSAAVADYILESGLYRPARGH